MILTVETHDGKTYEQEVEEYDPIALNTVINNDNLNTIVIGDLIISRINIKSLKPSENYDSV